VDHKQAAKNIFERKPEGRRKVKRPKTDTAGRCREWFMRAESE
jgi:hypothetical protein